MDVAGDVKKTPPRKPPARRWPVVEPPGQVVHFASAST
jgi:hypothetical protein